MHAWINFAGLIIIQAAVLGVVARRVGETKRITPRFLAMCGLLGAAFGVAFDVVFGEYLGIYGYILGFDLMFLLANGALSFGLMLAAVALLQRLTFFRFYAYTLVLGLVYETANIIFPVWYWQFAETLVVQETVLILAAYPALAILMAFVLTLTRAAQFEMLQSRN